MSHTINWRIEQEFITGRLVCTEPPESDCRMVCPEGCESWPCEHELVDGGACNPIEFIENSDGPVFCYGGPEAPLRDGEVVFTWNGDYYEWDYADVIEPKDPREIQAQ